MEEGIGWLTDFIKKLSHVVRCCLQLRAGFHPMHDVVPTVVTIDVRMTIITSMIVFQSGFFIFDV